MAKHFFNAAGKHLGSVSSGDLVFDINNVSVLETDDLYTYPIMLKDDVIERDIIKDLSSAKDYALKKIESDADKYQQRFLGVNSADRQARFAQNLAAAKRITAGTGTPEDIQSLTLQAAAKAAETGETPKTATEFAAWIAAWEGKTVLIAGAIESFLVQSRTGLNALSDVSQIEPFLAEIAAQAEAKFYELTVG